MPGAYTNLNNQRVKIWSAEIVSDASENNVAPGTIIKAKSKEGLLVSTGEGILKITELQMPNAKKMFTEDYLRGNSIEVGSILHG